MKSQDTPEQPGVNDNIITLDTPIQRGQTMIETITLRKPSSGELRGVSLGDLLNLDVASLIKVLPRISTPTLNPQEAAAMDPADLVAIGSKVISFLLQKSAKTEASVLRFSRDRSA